MPPLDAKNKADNLHLQMDPGLFSAEVKIHMEFLSSSPKLLRPSWRQNELMTRALVPQGDQTPSRAGGWLGQMQRSFWESSGVHLIPWHIHIPVPFPALGQAQPHPAADATLYSK